MVHDADGIDDATMLAYARETQLSETTFVQSGDAEADYRNRIWMTTGELPFAGHPSLGTAAAVAHQRSESQASYVQRTQVGTQPIDVQLDGLAARASMLQEPPEFGDELDPTRVLAPVGLATSDAAQGLPTQVVSTGVPQLIVPVAAGALDRVRPEAGALAELLDETGAITLYLAAWSGDHADARSFFLSAAGGAAEDPATGSAAGPLLAYVRERCGVEALSIDQGVAMGRPSRLDASWEGDRPRVGGDIVILSTGTLHL